MTLHLHEATAWLGGKRVLGPLSLTFAPGAFVGVVGPNGAGKSTLLRLLAGLLPLRDGSFELDGTALSRLGRPHIARQIAFVPQATSFELAFHVFEVVSMGRHPHGDADSDRGRQATARALSRLGLDAFSDRLVSTLSGGERQRVALARALASEAPTWLLDEPTAALDLRHSFDVLALAGAQARAGGLVIMTHHDLAAVRRVCDRVIVLTEGRLAADGAPRDALSPELIADVFGVEARVVTTPLGDMLCFHPAVYGKHPGESLQPPPSEEK